MIEFDELWLRFCMVDLIEFDGAGRFFSALKLSFVVAFIVPNGLTSCVVCSAFRFRLLDVRLLLLLLGNFDLLLPLFKPSGSSADVGRDLGAGKQLVDVFCCLINEDRLASAS